MPRNKNSFHKIIIQSFLLWIFSFTAFAQHPTCDGNRYKNITFFAVDSALNVQYGQNTTMNGVQKNLRMDIYQPKPDTAAKRPLIVLIHGGGFVAGSRKDMRASCILFAAKGFVTATIDYRLIDIPPVDSITVAEGIIHAVSDAKAAVRYFVEDAATENFYKVDTNFIFISGSSAGGVTASHVAYLDESDNIPAYFFTIISNNGGFTGNSSANTHHTVPIKGVLNYSGALCRSEWISEGEPPLYSFHDELDPIVPCGYGQSMAFPFPVYIYGSCAMQQEADLKGVDNGIFIFPGDGHGAYFSVLDTILVQTSNFLYENICSNTVSMNEAERMDSKFQVYPNPAQNYFIIELPQVNYTVDIVDLTGRKFYSKINVSEKLEVDCGVFPKGIYFIQVSTSKSNFCRKIIINN